MGELDSTSGNRTRFSDPWLGVRHAITKLSLPFQHF